MSGNSQNENQHSAGYGYQLLVGELKGVEVERKVYTPTSPARRHRRVLTLLISYRVLDYGQQQSLMVNN
jgi:hypothetical protein